MATESDFFPCTAQNSHLCQAFPVMFNSLSNIFRKEIRYFLQYLDKFPFMVIVSNFEELINFLFVLARVERDTDKIAGKAAHPAQGSGETPKENAFCNTATAKRLNQKKGEEGGLTV